MESHQGHTHREYDRGGAAGTVGSRRGSVWRSPRVLRLIPLPPRNPRVSHPVGTSSRGHHRRADWLTLHHKVEIRAPRSRASSSPPHRWSAVLEIVAAMGLARTSADSDADVCSKPVTSTCWNYPLGNMALGLCVLPSVGTMCLAVGKKERMMLHSSQTFELCPGTG